MKGDLFLSKNFKKTINETNLFLFIFISSILTTTDQIIKFFIEFKFELNDGFVVIPNIFKITYIKNFGAAFGFFVNRRVFLILITIILLTFFLWFLLEFKTFSLFYLIAFSSIVSGGIGNLIDRIFRGYVVDYCDLLFWPFQNFAIFNLADFLTVLGCVMLFIKIMFFTNEFEQFYI